MTEVHF